MPEKIVQTAGRDLLGSFAPAFAHYNDDILFGENWNDPALDLKTRSLIVISVFMGRGLIDSSLRHHLELARRNGVTREEIAGVITHAAFYAGWPVAWAVFNMAREVWAAEGEVSPAPEAAAPAAGTEDRQDFERSMLFPIGEPNNVHAIHFTGQSYLYPICNSPLNIHNVTFEPGCRNFWHIHLAQSGGGQILMAVAGRGYYQEWGQPARELHPGDVVNIPAGVKHWHGAAADSWFSHLAVSVPGEGSSTEWLDEVSAEDYAKLA